jgi:uncharacterized protein YcaQ
VSEIRHVPAAVARRFLVLRHLLAPPRSLPARPASVLEVIDRIGTFQFDPLEVAGRNHDLVLLARVAGYRRGWTEHWLYEDRRLYETYNKGLSIVPLAELPLYRETWDRSRTRHEGGTFDEHAPLVEEILGRIREGGVLQPRDMGPRESIDWYWRPTNQVRAVLEALAETGVLGIARREGNLRVYDLIERLVPPAILEDRRDPQEQLLHRLLSRFRGNGLLGAGGQSELWYGIGHHGAVARGALRDELVRTGALLPVRVDGFRGERFVVGDEIAVLDQAEREVAAGVTPNGAEPGAAFLAPLDPLCWDRDLLRRLFDFDYVWEVYVPEAKRRWGYYVLPILYGDRLVGRIEPRLNRRAGSLDVVGLWWEGGFDPLAEPGFTAAMADALLAHRDFGDLERITFPRAARHRPVVTAIRAALALRDSGPPRALVGRCTPRRRPPARTGATARQRPRPKEALDG